MENRKVIETCRVWCCNPSSASLICDDEKKINEDVLVRVKTLYLAAGGSQARTKVGGVDEGSLGYNIGVPRRRSGYGGEREREREREHSRNLVLYLYASVVGP